MTAFDPRDTLLEQRTVMVGGALDGETVADAAARLMMLDGRSARPVELVVSGRGGPVAGVLSLLDVVGLMRAPVTTICLGPVAGTAAALVAFGSGERLATPRASFSLRCDELTTIEGSASSIAIRAEELVAVRQRLVDALVAATGGDVAAVDDAMTTGRTLDADAALDFGLIDRIIDRRPGPVRGLP